MLQSSQIGITSGYGGTFSTDQGRLILGTPITVGDNFATIEKQEESALNKAGQVLAVGVAVLLGGGTRSLDTFVYRSDPEKYRAAVLAALDRTNQGVCRQDGVPALKRMSGSRSKRTPAAG